MPRSGGQSYTIAPFVDGTRRLRPPPCLNEPQRQVFVDLVSSLPAEHFRPSDITLLTRYCELVVMSEMAAVEMQSSGIVGRDGRPSAWFSIHERCTKSLALLALRLRLGPQSRARTASAVRPAKVSAYDKMRLLEADDDEQEEEQEQ